MILALLRCLASCRLSGEGAEGGLTGFTQLSVLGKGRIGMMLGLNGLGMDCGLDSFAMERSTRFCQLAGPSGNVHFDASLFKLTISIS